MSLRTVQKRKSKTQSDMQRCQTNEKKIVAISSMAKSIFGQIKQSGEKIKIHL